MSIVINKFNIKKTIDCKLSKANRMLSFLLLIIIPWSGAFAGRIVSDDFESGKEGLKRLENGFYWTNGKRTALTNEKSRTGNNSLKFTFLGAPDGDDSNAEQRFFLGGHYPELWIRYDLFVPANYAHREQSGSTNNKFIYLWSGDYSANFDGPGYSVQNWSVGDEESKAVPKAKGAPKSSGGFMFDDHYHSEGGRIFQKADLGKWLTIVVHAKYATSSNNNGVFQMWKIRDGKKSTVFDMTNGAWYVPGQPGFDKGYLFGWANSGFDKETVFYLDNIEFSTSPLLSGVVAAPKPPTLSQ